ncbi:hypothetical protein KPH14_002230 [Odynerus spinipes]|uniref:RING-type domain-containing protein n=1 Tax=Odynerus spinipes TaxID=1348599 RepID=A0AAD9RMC3_9HYME|nr:hypothetical protein KPH14_002230 [Odynerus spinipes]
MAIQGFTIFAVTIGLASLLYYMFANNEAQGQANSQGYSTSGHDPNIGKFSDYNSWDNSSNKDQPRQCKQKKKQSNKTPIKTTECIICLQEITNRRTILPCNHCFHNTCIDKWRSQGPAGTCNTCPICRNTYKNRYTIE